MISMPNRASITGDPLPSWNESAPRDQILEFLTAVTTPGGTDFVEPVARIATFDNDGTLWAEYPMIVQIQFALDRFRDLARLDPTILSSQSLRKVAEGDDSAIARLSIDELEAIALATHAGVSHEDLAAQIDSWLGTALHPTLGRPILDCVYLPMLELLALLHEHGFTCFVVTGGGAMFVRRFAFAAFGIPPHQVVGSSLELEFGMEGETATLFNKPRLRSFNDREEKVLNIVHHVGQRPILAVGNSDGDLATFRYVASGPGRSLRLLLHHDDPAREAAYDRDFLLSPLREALDVAVAEEVQVISMRQDWREVFLT